MHQGWKIHPVLGSTLMKLMVDNVEMKSDVLRNSPGCPGAASALGAAGEPDTAEVFASKRRWSDAGCTDLANQSQSHCQHPVPAPYTQYQDQQPEQAQTPNAAPQYQD